MNNTETEEIHIGESLDDLVDLFRQKLDISNPPTWEEIRVLAKVSTFWAYQKGEDPNSVRDHIQQEFSVMLKTTKQRVSWRTGIHQAIQEAGVRSPGDPKLAAVMSMATMGLSARSW